MADAEKHYRGFISYSQRDKDWGKRLHGWLEAYRVPLSGLVDVRLPPRLGRFFRDEEDMAAAADISETVRRVIEDAESLIVICSPRSAQSKWVNAEILHFRRTGRARKVFAFIIDGVPNSGDPNTECFPPALRAAGDPNDPDALPIEPLGLDVRKDGKARACARLAAGLLDLDFDDLWQRDRRRAERRQRLLLGGFAAASLVFAALAATAIVFGLQSQRRAALLSIDAAHAILQKGDADGALLLLLEAAKVFSAESAPDGLLIAFDEALQRAASETLYPLPQDVRLFDAPGSVYVVDPAMGSIALVDANGPPRVLVERMESVPVFVGEASDGALIVVREDMTIERRTEGRVETLGAFEPATVRAPTLGQFGGVPLEDITLSSDGVLLLQECWDCDKDSYRVQSFDTSTRRLHAFDLARNNRLDGRAYYARAPDGRRMIFSAGDMRELNGARPRIAPSRRDLMQWLCANGAPLQPDVAAALRASGEAFQQPSHCVTSDGAVLLTVATRSRSYYSPDGRSDYLFRPSDPIDDPRIQSWLHGRYLARPTFIYLTSGMRGDPFAQVSALDYDQPSGTLAVGLGADLLVGGKERMLAWRMPNLIARIQLLGDQTAAVTDRDGRFLRVLDLSTPHLYATRRMPNEEANQYYSSDAYMPSEENPLVCADTTMRVGGAIINVSVAATGDDSEGREARITLGGLPNRTIENRFPLGPSCLRMSANARYAAYVDPEQVAHILDLRRMGARAADFEIGALAGASDIAFPGDGPEVVVVSPGTAETAGRMGGVVIRRMAPSAGAGNWRVVEDLYRGPSNQRQARLDATGRRAILFEQVGNGDDLGAVIYSLEARRVWRRLGAHHRWFNAGFMTSGEVFTFDGIEDDDAAGWRPILRAITLHDLSQARAAAYDALSPHCRSFSGANYSASPCWAEAS